MRQVCSKHHSHANAADVDKIRYLNYKKKFSSVNIHRASYIPLLHCPTHCSSITVAVYVSEQMLSTAQHSPENKI